MCNMTENIQAWLKFTKTLWENVLCYDEIIPGFFGHNSYTKKHTSSHSEEGLWQHNALGNLSSK